MRQRTPGSWELRAYSGLTRLLGGLRIERGLCAERKPRHRNRYGSLLLLLNVGLHLGRGRRLGRFWKRGLGQRRRLGP